MWYDNNLYFLLKQKNWMFVTQNTYHFSLGILNFDINMIMQLWLLYFFYFLLWFIINIVLIQFSYLLIGQKPNRVQLYLCTMSIKIILFNSVLFYSTLLCSIICTYTYLSLSLCIYIYGVSKKNWILWKSIFFL